MRHELMFLDLVEEGFCRKTWHGPNLWQALKGVTAKEAAWRPAGGRHNIWEETLHAAYWKYAVRRKLQGKKRGGFALKGSNFFERPEIGRTSESAWQADKELLWREHVALRAAMKTALAKRVSAKTKKMIWGVAFHDVYHAGQIRLLRRLMEK